MIAIGLLLYEFCAKCYFMSGDISRKILRIKNYEYANNPFGWLKKSFCKGCINIEKYFLQYICIYPNPKTVSNFET